MKKRNIIITISLIFLFFIGVLCRLGYLKMEKGEYYNEQLKNKTEIYVEGSSTPRGRILDCNGKVLVDNIGVKTIVYNKIKGITKEEEIKIAYSLANILTFNYKENNKEFKTWWLLLNPEKGKNLITEEEYELLEERKLTTDDIKALKYKRINNKLLNSFNETDKRAAHIYALMNKGYSYDKKIITKDVSEIEYAKVLESKLQGITGEMTWERMYPYGDLLKSIFGSIGSIPAEKKEE